MPYSNNTAQNKNAYQDETRSMNRLTAIAAFLISITFFSYMCIKAYRYTIINKDISKLPLVPKGSLPIRTVPKDKGGIVIANQDKLIYKNLRSNAQYRYKKKSLSITNKKKNQVTETKNNSKINSKTNSNTKSVQQHNPQRSVFDLLN